MAEIGDTPTTEVSPLVDAGVKMTPPEPFAVSRYPFGVVVEENEIVFPLVVVVSAIGSVAESVEADTLFSSVWNSLVSIHVSDGSTARKSSSNSS
jgi:hypothetical protein